MVGCPVASIHQVADKDPTRKLAYSGQSVATDFDYKAFRLLRAFYDLAEGNPGTPVRGIDAAHKADIDYSWQEYTTLVAHLKDMEWLDNMNIVGDEMLRITPTGVREVEGGAAPQCIRPSSPNKMLCSAKVALYPDVGTG